VRSANAYLVPGPPLVSVHEAVVPERGDDVRVAIFGLGYVGTVTAACLAANGHEVWGVDVDPTKVAMVTAGRSPVVEPGLDELVREVVGAGHLHATASATRAVSAADVSLLCVGTPSTAQGGTNLTHVLRVVDDLAAALRLAPPPRIGLHPVVMRSTVPPGTVEMIGESLAAALGDEGPRTAVAMCPEFLREGTAIADFYSPPYTVVGATNSAVVEVTRGLFGFLDRPFRVVDVRTAEALKYACNAFHATKVSFTNELGRVFRRLGVDSRKVMALFCEDDQLNISTRYLRPGFAFGGSCLPKDLRALLHLARVESIDLPLLSGALATNTVSVADVVERVISEESRTVALLGLSFKSDSDDLRESPYVDLAETLLGKGYELRIYDPIINPSALIGANRDHVQWKLPHLRRLLTESPFVALAGADVAIVSYSAPDIAAALRAACPARIIDLDGRLGPEVEALAGYEGASW
jgi:GDP-mannose 6-dehydrogenase